jgi:arylsulfatase A-like enzyme/tetratricopeptide (TPR) repeat protein
VRNLLAIIVCAALAVSACAGGAPQQQPTNVLLITLDTVRADRLGAYGYQGSQTPAIDRIAAEGILFEHAIAPAPTTLPSHASLFTGLAPPSHGVRDNAANGLADSAFTMAEMFHDAGYATGAFVGAYVLDAGRGLAQGFDVYNGVAVAGISPTSLQEAERRGDFVVEAALPWLREQQGPWFAWIHLFDAHAPYAAPDPFGTRGADAYDGEIAWLDAIVGGLRGQLEGAGQWADTTVVLTADHGESLGEHGEPTHGFFVYGATTHIPLIVRPADTLDADARSALVRGSAVDTPVTLIDLFPTLAELQALTPPQGLQGRSLLPALRGETLEVVPIYSETLYPLLQFGWHDLRAVTVGADKLIEAPTVELYDLAADPGETDNLAAGSDRLIDELRGAMAPWVEPDLSGDAAAGVTSDPEQLAALRALGYVAVARAAGGASLPDPKDEIATFQQITNAMGAWRAGDTATALEIIDGLIAAEPDFAGAYHFRGLVLAGSGDNEGAVEAFRQALELDPEHGVAARALVRAYLALGRTEEAEQLLADLLARAPADAELRAELAVLYLQQSRVDDANELVSEGLQLDPAAARLYAVAGQVALQRQEPLNALEAFDRAAELEPGNFPVQMNRAMLLSQLGRQVDLINALEEALRARPGAPQAMLFLAQALYENGNPEDLERARQLAEDGLQRATNPQVLALGHTTLAEVYDALGRPDDAAAERREAARLSGGQ